MMSPELPIRLWDVRLGKCLRVLRGHEAPLKSPGFTTDHYRALSVDAGGTVIVWEIDWTFDTEAVRGPESSGMWYR